MPLLGKSAIMPVQLSKTNWMDRNAVELIVSILALVATPPQIVIVQTSLIGSMLSNLLLVMGMCFFFGGVSSATSPLHIRLCSTYSASSTIESSNTSMSP